MRNTILNAYNWENSSLREILADSGMQVANVNDLLLFKSREDFVRSVAMHVVNIWRDEGRIPLKYVLPSDSYTFGEGMSKQPAVTAEFVALCEEAANRRCEAYGYCAFALAGISRKAFSEICYSAWYKMSILPA